MSEAQTVQSVQKIKALYQELYQKYQEETDQIENIDELYTKFRNLKLYEAEFDKHEELKKEMSFWNNPQFHQKSQKELELERELHKSLEQNAQLKAQVAALQTEEYQGYRQF